MGADVLTTWGVVLEREGVAAEEHLDSATRSFAQGRDAYFERCPRLAVFLRDAKAELHVADEHVDPVDGAIGPGGLRIGVSVIEVRPSSFTMAVRLRALGADPTPPANGHCTVAIKRRSGGERIPIPREVRDEFVAIQLAAWQLC